MTVIIRKDSLIATPWKNGGGATTEIAIAPPGADFDHFDWRVSLATIAGDGAFSVFPGIDRTLTLVEGAGVTLEIDDRHAVCLSPDHPTICFAGESKVFATLTQGSTTDFNVMTRRRFYQQDLERISFRGRIALLRRGDITLLFLAEGNATCSDQNGEPLRLENCDALLLEADDPQTWTLEAHDSATLFVVHLNRSNHAAG